METKPTEQQVVPAAAKPQELSLLGYIRKLTEMVERFGNIPVTGYDFDLDRFVNMASIPVTMNGKPFLAFMTEGDASAFLAEQRRKEKQAALAAAAAEASKAKSAEVKTPAEAVADVVKTVTEAAAETPVGATSEAPAPTPEQAAPVEGGSTPAPEAAAAAPEAPLPETEGPKA